MSSMRRMGGLEGLGRLGRMMHLWPMAGPAKRLAGRPCVQGAR
jgi:hypothetical protein